ncbi:MAG: prepilin-type N-terminal cleavage/methylation domain-containing protein [Patescibacteria group bacterium]
MKKKGFTLIELMITVSIFAIMTALLVAKYGTFNNGVILTNLAYDIALSIRSAQSYGLNTRGDSNTNTFTGTYTVSFVKNEKSFSLVGSDLNKVTNIKRGSYISRLCVGTDQSSCQSSPIDALSIAFNRPEPNARINGNNAYGEIEVKSIDGATRKIVVRSTGQIFVSN